MASSLAAQGVLQQHSRADCLRRGGVEAGWKSSLTFCLHSKALLWLRDEAPGPKERRCAAGFRMCCGQTGRDASARGLPHCLSQAGGALLRLAVCKEGFNLGLFWPQDTSKGACSLVWCSITVYQSRPITYLTRACLRPLNQAMTGENRAHANVDLVASVQRLWQE